MRKLMNLTTILILIWLASILIGFFVLAQYEMRSDNVLPECDFSMTFQLQGQHHSGYWVEQDALNKNVCAIRFNEPVTIVDGGK